MNAPAKAQPEATRVSEAPLTAEQAFQALQSELPKPPKTAEGQIGQRKYPYSTIADVWDVVRPLIAKHGFSISQTEVPHETFVMLATRLVYKDGTEYCASVRPIASFEQACRDPQAYGSSMTYARRYSIISMLGLTPDDDDGAAGKAAGHKSLGESVPAGPRGGQDKSKAGDDEIKLRGYPENGTTTTKRYPRKISGVAMFIDDLEIAVGFDPMNWDINSEGIEIARLGIEKSGRNDLRDRLDNLEIRAEDLARNMRAG